MLRTSVFACALVAAAISACYSGKKVEDGDGAPTVVQSSNPTEPADAPVTTTCTSKLTWSGKDTGSKRMHPGLACIGCHTKTVAELDAGGAADGGHHHGPPIFTAAGTVFGGDHDEDDCIGVSDAPQIVITGADGVSVTVTANQAGNFYTTAPLVFPVTAQITSSAGTQTMHDPVKTGECNACHTALSDDPGRITED